MPDRRTPSITFRAIPVGGVRSTMASPAASHSEDCVSTTPSRKLFCGLSCVADHQLASTTPAADKAGEQSVAVLRRSVMSACGQVVAHLSSVGEYSPIVG